MRPARSAVSVSARSVSVSIAFIFHSFDGRTRGLNKLGDPLWTLLSGSHLDATGHIEAKGPDDADGRRNIVGAQAARQDQFGRVRELRRRAPIGFSARAAVRTLEQNARRQRARQRLPTQHW